VDVNDSWLAGLPANIIGSLLAQGLIVILGLIFVFGRKHLQRHRRSLRQGLLVLLWTGYISANLLNSTHPLFAPIPFFIVSSLFIAGVIWVELFQFWRIGLVGADKSMEKGLGFKQSLDLCTNSLDFLGISGSKLTSERPAFENAIARCNRDTRPIRLLLCNPGNHKLVEIARQAGKPDEEYQYTVRRSLQMIADLKLKRHRNIEVRFYENLPLFRLMFIDDSLCLASHYVFGEGDGAQLPQLHVRKPAPASYQRDVETLYHPFRKYFDELWEQAKPWDFHI
jgi:hypothetical protein